MRRPYVIALLLTLCICCGIIVAPMGCVSSGGGTVEVQNWRQTADFYASRVTAFRTLVASEPPGPKRDALIKELDRIDHLRLYAEGMIILLAGPPAATQPAK